MPKNVKKALYEQFSRTTKALSNPARMQIIDLLSQGEKSVEAIAREIKLGIKNASAQLRELKSAELVDSRKEGKYVYYFLTDPEVVNLWHSIRSFGERRFSEIQKLAEQAFSGPDEFEIVDRKAFLEKVKKGKIILLDVRPSDEFESDHIPFAISIPSTEIAQRLRELPKDKEIVAYCRGPYCFMAKAAVEILRKKGFKAFRIKDGVHDWAA